MEQQPDKTREATPQTWMPAAAGVLSIVAGAMGLIAIVFLITFGATFGAETSIDKVLVATAEQATYEAARRILPGVVEMDDGPIGEAWRSEYLYSRAATIYGGTAEVQRNIIARRLLDLGEDA